MNKNVKPIKDKIMDLIHKIFFKILSPADFNKLKQSVKILNSKKILKKLFNLLD